MKDAEDEAFDDLARKQGDWGGGFKAKQGMAMHKTQDQNICRHYKQWQHCHICDLEAQSAELAGIKAILDKYGLQAIDFVADFKEALAKPAQEPDALTIAYQSGFYDGKKAALAGREWNFCERCGKRTADKTAIHTCTPPQENK